MMKKIPNSGGRVMFPKWGEKIPRLNIYPTNIFVMKMAALTSAAYIQVHFRLEYSMKANTI